MEPLLAQAYETLLTVERLAGVSLVGRKSIANEVADANAAISGDISAFNRLVQQLMADRESLDLAEIKSRLIDVRIQAMNIETEFGNLAAAIAQVFVQVPRSDV